MFDVIKLRKTSYIVSSFLLVLSLALLLFAPLNYWIDITWWTQTEYSYAWDTDIQSYLIPIQELSTSVGWVENSVISTVSLYKITGEDKFVVETWFVAWLDEVELESYKTGFRDQVSQYLQERNPTIEFTRYVNIWASFWDYIRDTAKVTLVLAIIGIALYVAYAFSQSVGWISSISFASVTILTLFHDVIIASGLYIIVTMIFPDFRIDTFFVTALLTILGYSINDTIVVFDRIRGNLKLFGWKKKELKEIVNMSVNETVRRSIYTSVTIFFVLGTILVFGPESIAWFTLVMIFGTIVWTYSSIFIASPLIFDINKNKKLTTYTKKVKTDEDYIVV